MQTEQEEFDAKYISSSEICRRLSINRATIVTARARGKLPKPIEVSSQQGQVLVLFWLRTAIEPILTGWETELKAFRAARA